jgi:arginine decarboxylase
LVDGEANDLPLWAYEIIQGCVWPLEDTPAFIAGRIARAVAEYSEHVLPPFFRALRHFDAENGYSRGWRRLSEIADRPRLLRLLRRAAVPQRPVHFGRRTRVTAGAHRSGRRGRTQRRPGVRAPQTFFVLNGNSTANRVVGHHRAVAGETMLVDRNCHKSILHALTINGATPSYLVPQRNGSDWPVRSPRRSCGTHRTPCRPSSPTPPTTACATTRSRVATLLDCTLGGQ